MCALNKSIQISDDLFLLICSWIQFEIDEEFCILNVHNTLWRNDKEKNIIIKLATAAVEKTSSKHCLLSQKRMPTLCLFQFPRLCSNLLSTHSITSIPLTLIPIIARAKPIFNVYKNNRFINNVICYKWILYHFALQYEIWNCCNINTTDYFYMLGQFICSDVNVKVNFHDFVMMVAVRSLWWSLACNKWENGKRWLVWCL